MFKPQIKKLARSIIAIGLLGAAPFAAQSAVITYSSQGAFLSAVSGTATLDFEAQNTNGPSSYVYYGSNLTIGDVSFGQPDARMFVFGQSYYQTHGLTSSYLNQNCCAPSGINVNFANPVFGVGMDLGIQNTWDDASLSVTFSLSTGDILTTTGPLLLGTTNGMAFFGFTSDVAITSFNVNGPSNGVAIDNFIYTSNGTSVPEPATSALLALALVGLGLGRARKPAKAV